MDEQVLSIRAAIHAIRRHPRVLLIFVLIGLLGGAAYVRASTSLVSARSLVLLPNSQLNAQGQPTIDPLTEVQTAMSQLVLPPAAKSAGLNLSFATLQHRVAVTDISARVLQITAEAATAPEADRLANAVATTFVAFASNPSLQADQQVAAMNQQETALSKSIAQVGALVATLQRQLLGERLSSAQYQSTKTALENTESVATIDESTLNLLKADAAEAAVSGPGAQVLQSATALKPSRLHEPMFIALGGVAGLLVGALVAFTLAKRDRRLRSRDGIAAAVDAPVLQSLAPVARRTTKQWSELLSSWQPSVAEKARLRNVLNDLGFFEHRRSATADAGPRGGSALRDGEHELNVTVVALAGDRPALAFGPELATFASTYGAPIGLIVAHDDDSVAPLQRACSPGSEDSGMPRQNLATFPRPPEARPFGLALTVTVIATTAESVDAVEWDAVGPTGIEHGQTIIAVSSGYALSEQLRVVADAAADARHPVSGVVVTCPDPTDDTVGQIWQMGGRHAHQRIATARRVAR